MGLIRNTKKLVIACFAAFFDALESLEGKLQSKNTDCCKKTMQGLVGLCLFGLALGGFRAYETYRIYEDLPSCREKIDYLIEHKTLFTVLLKTKRFTQELLIHVNNQNKKTASMKLAHWLEGRLVQHLAKKDIKSVNDLPLLDRSVIRTLDSTSSIGDMLLQGINGIMSLFGFSS